MSVQSDSIKPQTLFSLFSVIIKFIRVLKAIKIKKLELGESVSQLDLREYPAGIYYFRMSTEKDTFIRKIEKGY